MSSNIVRFPLVLISLVCSPMANAAWVTADLGALDGLAGFNARGTVAGNQWIYGPAGGYRGAGAIVDFNGQRTTITAGLSTGLSGMNEAGTVIGRFEVRRGVLGGEPGASHAFSYHDGQLRDLGTLGGRSSSAVAINKAGIIAGTSFTSSGAEHAFVADAAGMHDLGTLGGSFSSAQALNDRGYIAGIASDGSGAIRWFLSDGQTMQALGTSSYQWWQTPARIVAFTNSGLVVTENGDLFDASKPGNNSRIDATLRDANESGQVVGHMAFAGEAGYRAVVYRDGVITNLGVLSGGMYSSALDINERGQVVGYSHTGAGPYHAFLYTGGTMYDIADLVTGFTEISTGSIMLNDRGQVAGIGKVGNEYRAFLLTDDTAVHVPEPGTLTVTALGLALLARRRRQYGASVV